MIERKSRSKRTNVHFCFFSHAGGAGEDGGGSKLSGRGSVLEANVQHQRYHPDDSRSLLLGILLLRQFRALLLLTM